MLRLIALLLAVTACGTGQSARLEARSPEPLPTTEDQEAFASASLRPFASLGSGVRRIDVEAP